MKTRLPPIWNILGLASFMVSGVSCSNQNGSVPGSPAAKNPEVKIVAEIGGTTITLDQFEAELNKRVRTSPVRVEATSQKSALLEEMIRNEALYQRALAAGYATNPAIVAQIKRLVVHRFRQDSLDAGAKTNSPATVPAEDVAAYYAARLKEFTIPDQRKGALLFLNLPAKSSATKIAEIKTKAESLRNGMISSSSKESSQKLFAELAQRHSDDAATRFRGGDMGWVQQRPNGKWEPAVVEALFALTQPDEISPIITTSRGLYLVKLIESKPALARPLTEVEDGIRQRLFQDNERRALEAFHASQTSQVPVRVFPNVFDAARTPAMSAEEPPAALPGT